MVTDQPRCLRCKTIVLNRLPSPSEITFFECPSCRRRYSLKPGKGLTFQWGHPISLVLYFVLFDRAPVGRAAEAAATLAGQRTAEELQTWIREIQLELDEPTQQVRHILDCPASEDDLREYIHQFVVELDRLLAEASPDSPQGRR